MTSSIVIRVNGNYVAEGVVQLDHGQPPNPIKVGPSVAGGGPVETSINLTSGAVVSVNIKERSATEEEIAAVNVPVEEKAPPAPDSSESSD